MCTGRTLGGGIRGQKKYGRGEPQHAVVARCQEHLGLREHYNLYDLFYLAMQRDAHALAMNEVMSCDYRWSQILDFLNNYSPVTQWPESDLYDSPVAAIHWQEIAEGACASADSLLRYIWRCGDLYELGKDLRDKMGIRPKQQFLLPAEPRGQLLQESQILHPRRRAQILYQADPSNMTLPADDISKMVVVIAGRPVVVRRSRVQS